MFDFASTMAPASLMRFTWNASLVETNPASASEPAGALQADGLEVVLHDHRHAVQRTGRVRPARSGDRASSACVSASG